MTVRVVDLTGENAKHFPWLYEGLLLGGAMKQQRPAEVLKRERKILRKLRMLGQPALDEKNEPKKTQTGEPMLEAKPEGGVLTLELDEVKLLVDYIEGIPWLVTKADYALEASEYVESSPKKEE